MTTAKNEVLNWWLLKNCYSVGTVNLNSLTDGLCVCVCGGGAGGGGLLGGILASEGDFPRSPK